MIVKGYYKRGAFQGYYFNNDITLLEERHIAEIIRDYVYNIEVVECSATMEEIAVLSGLLVKWVKEDADVSRYYDTTTQAVADVIHRVIFK